MAYDPTTDIDPGYDIEGHTADDDMGQQEQREQAAVTPRFRPTAPGVYSPTPAPRPTPQRQGITPPEHRTNYPPADDSTSVAAEEYGFAPSAAPVGTGKTTYKDYGDMFVASALGSAGALASGVSWVQHQINSDPQYRAYADSVKDFAEQHAAATLDGMSDRAKQILKESLFGGSDRDAEGNAIPSAWGDLPAYLAMHAVGMIPDALAMLLPGGILGRVAVKGLELAGGAARAIKAGETVATLTKAGETAKAIGHGAGTAGYFSVENGGEMARTINNEIDKAPDLDLQSGSDVYKHLRDSGLGVDAAKTELKKQSTMMTVGAFAAGAVGGGGFGVLGKGVVRGAIAGAGAMGIQGGATQALQQGAEKAMGTRTDYDLGSIMSDTLTSGAGGLLLGAVGGRFAGRERAPKPGVDPDVGEAFRTYDEPAGPPEAGPGRVIYPNEPPGPQPPPQADLGVPPVPPGGTAARPQGEMFTPQEQGPRVQPGQPAPEGAPPAVPPQYQTAAIGAEGERTPGYRAPQPPSPALDEQGRPIQIAGVGESVAPVPPPTPGGLTGAPAPPQLEPVSRRSGGIPGATQQDLPINQTPPTIVPTTGQGEMFPSLPEANPPVQGATVPMTEMRGEEPAPTTPPGGTPSAGTPPAGGAPTGGKPMSASERKRALVAELTGKPGAPSVAKLRRGKIADLEKMRDQLNATQRDTTVVNGADRAPASETLARQGPSETAAPPVSGEALTPPVAPEGVRETTPAAKPAATKSTTGLTEGLSGAARAIGENLRNHLWEKHQAGDTTEAGKPSNILRASTYLKERGVITDRASFEKFLDDYGAAQKAGELKTKAGADKFFEKQLTGQEPAPEVRPEGGPSPDTMAKSGEGIAPKVEVEAKAETKAEAAVKVSKRKPAKKVLEIPRRTSEVYVEEPTKGTREELTEATPEVEQARADRAGDLAEAVRVVPAPKGSGMEAALRKAQRELGEAIGKTDGSKDAAAEAIDGWMGVQTTAPYPGTKVTPRMLGEHLMERVARQRPTEREGARADIAETRREDAARRASEPKATAGDVENIAEARSEGAEGTSAITPEVKQSKRLDTTDQRRVVDNLIQRVLNHDMTPEEADREYGKPQKGPGAKRRWPRLADRLRDWIAHAEDPKVERDILEKLAATQNNDRLTPHEKSTQTKQLTRQLERTGPEFASELREHLRGMEDPVGQRADLEAKMAADKAAREGSVEKGMASPAPKPDGIDPRSARGVRVSTDPRFGANLRRQIEATWNHGLPLTGRDLARIIRNDPMVQHEVPYLAHLATQLERLAPHVEVMSAEEAHGRGLIDDARMDAYNRGEFSGQSRSYFHTPERDFIILHLDNAQSKHGLVVPALHELSHSITSRLLDHLERTDPSHPYIQAMKALMDEVSQHLWNDQLSGVAFGAHELGAIKYALTDIHELHTMALTDPLVHGYLASRQASPRFAAQMRSAGFDPKTPGRSLWRYFVGSMQKLLGLRAATSPAEYSLLDHVMRPLQDIAEHGARYNERLALPADPVLKARAEPFVNAALRSMGPRAREIINHVDPAGLGDRMRRKVLVATSNDAIHDWNKDILPSLTRWREANENISAASNEFAGKYGDRVQELNGRINKADDKSNLSNLMVNVGVHESHIGENLPADANAHLTTPEQLRGLHEDQAAYNGLSTKDKAIYNDTKKLYNEMYGDERKATARSIVNAFTTDLTEAQKDAFTTGVRSQASLERFMANPDNSDIARAFGPDWANKRSIVTNMAKLHALGFVKGDYFPLRRFGNYVVSYGDRADLANYGVEMFDSYTKAQERRAELVRQGHTDVNQVAKKDDTHMGDIRARPAFADELASALRHSGFDQGHVEHVTDLMNDMLLRHATQSEAARARLRRRGVKGASTDATRVLSAEFLSKQARHGYLLHGLDRAQRLNDIHDEAKAHEGPSGTPGAAVRAMSVYQEIAKRMTKPEDHDNLVRKIASTANSVSFVQNLMSVSHMLTSTMETHGNSLALLGARHGYARTSLALIRAMKDASPAVTGEKGGARNAIKALGNRLKTSDWNLAQAVVDEMASKPGVDGALVRMLGKEAVRTGIIDHTILQDIRQAMSPAGNIGTGAQKVWNMFYNSNAAMAHSVDVMNKLAVLKAAGELEMRRPGTTREQAVAHAIQMARRVMPNYTTANRSRLSSNPVMGTLLQFKRYGMHMYELMGNLARESVHGENKWEARKQLAGILATHSAMAGTLTLIADPLRYIGGAYDVMSGRATTSGFHDYQNDVRNWLSDTFGPEAGEIIARGAPHALGFDVHRRTGLANLLEVPEMTAFNKTGAAQVLLSLTTGAAGETLQAYIDGLRKFRNGDLGGAFKDFAPRPFRDAFKGADIATNGIRDTKGKVIMAPEKIGISGGIIQALGFQPSSVSEFREGRAAVREAQMEQKGDRSQLTSRWLNADPADRPAVMSEIRQFNADPRNVGTRIQVSQLLQQLHQRQKDTHAPPGAFGLRMPKRGAEPLMHEGRFANG